MRSFVVLFSVQYLIADLMCPYMYRAYPRGLLPVLVSVTVSLAKAAGSRRPITQNIREYYIFSYESTRETYDVVCIHCIHTELKQPHDNSSTLCMYTTSSYSSSISTHPDSTRPSFLACPYKECTCTSTCIDSTCWFGNFFHFLPARISSTSLPTSCTQGR